VPFEVVSAVSEGRADAARREERDLGTLLAALAERVVRLEKLIRECPCRGGNCPFAARLDEAWELLESEETEE
jgi:hypothetical protein